MTNTARTTCPFCLNGCESAVAFDGYQYRTEYVADGRVNKGRLCPRGNSANLIIDHPKRLSLPLLDGRETTWDAALDNAGKWRETVGPYQTAIVYSRGYTESELALVYGFAAALGVKNLVSGHVEPENCFSYRLAGVADATLEQMANAKSMLLVGDVFSTSPVAAGPMLDARYADKKNRMVVIDSVKTRQAGFAHAFIQVRPGTEPFALGALAGLLDRKLRKLDIDRLARLAGVERAKLEDAAGMLGGTGFVASAMHMGRVSYPMLHSLMSQLVALSARKPFLAMGEARLPLGPMSFGDLRKAAAEGSIRLVYWLGGLYPYSYGQVVPEFKDIEHRVATSVFWPEEPVKGLLLPVPSELEKESSGYSYWGEVQRLPVAAPYSGTRPVSRVLTELAGRELSPVRPARTRPIDAADAVKMVVDLAASDPGQREGLVLVGEKKAIGIKGLHDPENTVSLNAADAEQLGVTDEDYVSLATGQADGEYRVHVTDAVPPGVLAVGVNAHRNRALFVLETGPGDEPTIPPTTVDARRVGRLAQPASEMRAS